MNAQENSPNSQYLNKIKYIFIKKNVNAFIKCNKFDKKALYKYLQKIDYF